MHPNFGGYFGALKGLNCGQLRYPVLIEVFVDTVTKSLDVSGSVSHVRNRWVGVQTHRMHLIAFLQ